MNAISIFSCQGKNITSSGLGYNWFNQGAVKDLLLSRNQSHIIILLIDWGWSGIMQATRLLLLHDLVLHLSPV